MQNILKETEKVINQKVQIEKEVYKNRNEEIRRKEKENKEYI